MEIFIFVEVVSILSVTLFSTILISFKVGVIIDFNSSIVVDDGSKGELLVVVVFLLYISIPNFMQS